MTFSQKCIYFLSETILYSLRSTIKMGRRFEIAKTHQLFAYAVMFVVLAVAAVPHIVRNWFAPNTEDFGYFYQAARAMWHGKDIYEATNWRYIYPPFLALIFQPLTLLAEHPAAIVWAILSVLLILTASLIAAEEMTRRWHWGSEPTWPSFAAVSAAMALVLSAKEIYADLQLGQTDCLMLLGFACVLRWMGSKPWLAGLAVGAAANVKYLSLIFIPYFLIKRNYKAAVASIIWSLVFILLPAAEVGVSAATRFVRASIGVLVKMASAAPILRSSQAQVNRISWDRSVSITSAIIRATRSHGLPDWMAAVLIGLAFAVMIAGVFFLSKRHGVELFRPELNNRHPESEASVSLEWAVLIVVAAIFSPQTTPRHMVLILLVNVVASGLFLLQTCNRCRLLLALTTILMAVGLSFPPHNIGIDELLWTWRRSAGASLCAVVFITAIVSIGSRTIAELSRTSRQSNKKGSTL
jgi:hypothetical protein